MMLRLVNVFLLSSLCEAQISQISQISQPVSFQAVKLGDPATMECYIKSSLTKRAWYKFTTGKRLQLVATVNSHYNRSVVSDEFHQHYSVKSDGINSHLSISAAAWEDVGTYFCGVLHLNDIQFGSGTFLMLNGLKTIGDRVVQQPESKSVRPGDSVTLSCSVHTGHCAAEHTRVMWLKHSDHAAPGIVYSSGREDDTCQRTESGQTTCVYTLLMRNLSSDDAGTYYCAVTSCGRMLFGNGTRIHIYTDKAEVSPTVIALMLSNVILGMVTLILVWTLCKSRRKESTEATDGAPEGNQTSDAAVYAAVCLVPRSLSPRQATAKYSGDSVVYSDIRHCQPS